MNYNEELDDIRNYSIGCEAIERYDDLCERMLTEIEQRDGGGI